MDNVITSKAKRHKRIVKGVIVAVAIGLMVLIHENALAISIHLLVDIVFPSLDN